MNMEGITISEPAKKGIGSSLYGLATLGGAFLKYFAAPLKIALGAYTAGIGNIVLGALTAYSLFKGTENLYASTLEENKGHRRGYIGRALTDYFRSFGTYNIPWIQGTLSLTAGEERIRKDEYYGWDFPAIIEHEKEKAEARNSESTEEDSE